MENNVIRHGKLLTTINHISLDYKKVEMFENTEHSGYTCKFYDQSEIDGMSQVSTIKHFNTVSDAFVDIKSFLKSEGKQKLANIKPVEPTRVTEEGLARGMK